MALISVWNPTFLTLLMSRLPGWHSRLAHDLETGSLSPPTPIPQEKRLSALNTPDPRGGQRAGDIKPVALHTTGGWSRRFEGRFVDPEG
jgi:hypothetical protein